MSGKGVSQSGGFRISCVEPIWLSLLLRILLRFLLPHSLENLGFKLLPLSLPTSWTGCGTLCLDFRAEVLPLPGYRVHSTPNVGCGGDRKVMVSLCSELNRHNRP